MPTFEEWLVSMGFDPKTMSAQQQASLKEFYDVAAGADQDPPEDSTGPAQTPPPPPVAAEAFDFDEIRAEHHEMGLSLEEVFAEFEDDLEKEKYAEIRAEARDELKGLKKKALSERWSTEMYQARAQAFLARTEAKCSRSIMPKGPAIHAASHDCTGDIIEAALAETLRIPGFDKMYPDQTLQSGRDLSRRNGTMSLHQAMIMAAESNGWDGPRVFRVTSKNVKQLMRYAFPQIEASSTMNLSGILSNIANKELLAGYQLGEQYEVWRKVARTKPVSDFKTVTSYRLTGDMEYELVGADGKIKHGTVGEETYTRRARTYAKMFTLNREQIINDDLGALDDIRTQLGAGSARKFNKLFWSLWLNNSTHFTALRGNLITGADSELTEDGVGLDIAVQAFNAIVNGDGTRSGYTPKMLLVPPELQVIADRIYGKINPTRVADYNTFAGKFEPVTATWLSDSSFANSSQTGWYLLGDPNVLPTVVVSFLDGQESPTIDSADADFDTLGVDFRGFHDFGVDWAEWANALKSAGQ